MPFDEYFSSKTKGRYGVMFRGSSVNGNMPKSGPVKEPKKRVRPPTKVWEVGTKETREDCLAQQFKDVTGL